MALKIVSVLCSLAVAVAGCGTAQAQGMAKPDPSPAVEEGQEPVKVKPGVAPRDKSELPRADAPLPVPGGSFEPTPPQDGLEPTRAGQVTYLSPDRWVGLLGVGPAPAPSPTPTQDPTATPAPSSAAARFFDQADRRIVLSQLGARARSQVQSELRARGADAATIVRGNLLEVLEPSAAPGRTSRVARCAFVVRVQPSGAAEPREETVTVEVPLDASQAEVLQRTARS